MTRSRRDPMSVVERAYDLDAPEAEWVKAMLEAAAPSLDTGPGLMGFVANLAAPGEPIARSPATIGGPPAWQRTWRSGWWESLVLTVPRDLMVAILSFGPVSFGSHVSAAVAKQIDTFDQFVDALAQKGFESVFGRRLRVPESQGERPIGFPESLFITAGDPTGHVVALFANRTEIAHQLPSRSVVRAWSRVASHVAAAHRMRRRLGPGPLEGAEAIVTPRGKVVHAEGPAQDPGVLERLRSAAIGVDRARTARVRSTDEALELWRAVHEGRWSITDTFDHDGRRFLVARENEPASDPAPTLSRREQQVLDLLALGHSNKQIAYDLGISTSSVATHLRRAATKLALPSSRELVRWARARRRPIDPR